MEGSAGVEGVGAGGSSQRHVGVSGFPEKKLSENMVTQVTF